ncbi:hypothetical protein [Luteipulveratus mongoliensis]|uniref:Uncharacterized protein n=1 Tax=Luteipulveratus mongoliensis TaxID=571913 RepID=A0A0K1JFF8_9MICO|nr:hypothetical protein [Luteipulveratus mongoliensis]AKU15457.1 hypothetical protein VV02_05550 [Luteipulveratus mongoliensis]
MVILVICVVAVIAFGLLVTALTRRGASGFRGKRRDTKNTERQAYAASRGWQFAEADPSLVDRWPVRPFTQRGDNRRAFGVVHGATTGGVRFTAFDYERRASVTSHGIHETETYEVLTVWVLPLPAAAPDVQVFPNFIDMGATGIPLPDKKFGSRYVVQSGDPAYAAGLFTPEVMAHMKAHKLEVWALHGSDLIYTQTMARPNRTRPEQLEQTADQLAQLVALLPASAWKR